MIGGVVITNDDLAERLAFLQTIGAIQGPFDSFSFRGLKALPLRMERHNYNAKIGILEVIIK